jgi:DNA-binding NarL/FixJ family response regulator
MNPSTPHIALLEASKIVAEGLQAILYQCDMHGRIHRLEALDELPQLLEAHAVDILIANPLLWANREKDIRKIKKNHPTLAIAAIDHGAMYKPLLAQADVAFTLYDPPEQIAHLLAKLNKKNQPRPNKKDGEENLTKREIEVLTGLVSGMLNKEIADALSISIHTVVRHRKNIAAKTGIRSQSGLTIYAISKKIISIEEIEI